MKQGKLKAIAVIVPVAGNGAQPPLAIVGGGRSGDVYGLYRLADDLLAAIAWMLAVFYGTVHLDIPPELPVTMLAAGGVLALVGLGLIGLGRLRRPKRTAAEL